MVTPLTAELTAAFLEENYLEDVGAFENKLTELSELGLTREEAHRAVDGALSKWPEDSLKWEWDSAHATIDEHFDEYELL